MFRFVVRTFVVAFADRLFTRAAVDRLVLTVGCRLMFVTAVLLTLGCRLTLVVVALLTVGCRLTLVVVALLTVGCCLTFVVVVFVARPRLTVATLFPLLAASR